MEAKYNHELEFYFRSYIANQSFGPLSVERVVTQRSSSLIP